jgi:hypothetical protein
MLPEDVLLAQAKKARANATPRQPNSLQP